MKEKEKIGRVHHPVDDFRRLGSCNNDAGVKGSQVQILSARPVWAVDVVDVSPGWRPFLVALTIFGDRGQVWV
jgi:hypothetical protein